MPLVEKDLGLVLGKDANIVSATGTVVPGHSDSPTVQVEVGGEAGANTLEFTFSGIQGIDGTAGDPATVPVATDKEAGKVKPDGDTITVDSDGTIKVNKVQATSIQGEVPLANLPQGALERVVTVADETARFKLTTAVVQLGDVVQQLDTKVMYVVVDESNLASATGYTEFTAGTATKASTADNATNAVTATKLGSDTVGAATTPIYLNQGTPTACNSFLTTEDVATSDKAGVVKPDGTILKTTEDGTLSLDTTTLVTKDELVGLLQSNIEVIREALGLATTEHMGLVPPLPTE